jgi:drug/metabolite transporter (DMT)-like permease
VFVIASAIGVEKPQLKRFCGLALGIMGVLIIIWYGEKIEGNARWIWLMIALLIPITYAAEDVYVAKYNPAHLDGTAVFGITLAIASLFLAPIAFALDDFIPLNFLSGKLGIIIVVMALSATTAMVLFISLVKTTGAVFASQSGYVITAGGIGWSILLLGEHIPVWTWAALGLVIAGLIMVEPKKEAEEDPPLITGEFEDSPI